MARGADEITIPRDSPRATPWRTGLREWPRWAGSPLWARPWVVSLPHSLRRSAQRTGLGETGATRAAGGGAEAGVVPFVRVPVGPSADPRSWTAAVSQPICRRPAGEPAASVRTCRNRTEGHCDRPVMATARPRSMRVRDAADLPFLLAAAGLSPGPVLVLVGGAGGLESGDAKRLLDLFRDHLVPAVVRSGASVVDGGTDSGVMRAIGSARSDTGSQFPLVGVAAGGTVPPPGDLTESQPDAQVDPNHSHIVLVPGDTWGDESPWLSAVAGALSAGHPSATLLVNGGEIAYDDVHLSLAAGRPVIVLAGSGRTADAIAFARLHPEADERARRTLASPLVRVVSIDAPGALASTVRSLLAP